MELSWADSYEVYQGRIPVADMRDVEDPLVRECALRWLERDRVARKVAEQTGWHHLDVFGIDLD